MKVARDRRRAATAAHHAIVARAPKTIAAPVPRGLPRPSAPSAHLPPRELKNQYVCEVGRFTYKLIHRMEGKWNGDAIVYSGGGGGGGEDGPARRVVSVRLSFNEKERRWEEHQTLTASTGLASTQLLHFDPSADGVLTVTTDDPALVGVVDMRLEEISDSIMVLTAVSHVTRQPLIVETITMSDDLHRVRTVQRFGKHGEFECLYMIQETRVIDSQSGAVETMP